MDIQAAVAEAIARSEEKGNDGYAVFCLAQVTLRLNFADKQRAIRIWMDLASECHWIETANYDFEDVYDAVIQKEKSVRVPHGEDYFEAANKRAKAIARQMTLYRGDRVRPRANMLLALIAVIEQDRGEVFLSVRSAAKHLETTPAIAESYLNRLVDEGYIEVVRKGNFAGKRANEYKVMISLPRLPNWTGD